MGPDNQVKYSLPLVEEFCQCAAVVYEPTRYAMEHRTGLAVDTGTGHIREALHVLICERSALGDVKSDDAGVFGGCCRLHDDSGGYCPAGALSHICSTQRSEKRHKRAVTRTAAGRTAGEARNAR